MYEAVVRLWLSLGREVPRQAGGAVWSAGADSWRADGPDFFGRG